MNISKGITTKEIILKEAFKLASRFGLESLSIGELAKSVGMSKSGLFGHFNSKERLQIMVLDYAAKDWVEKVIHPATKMTRGIPRLLAIMDNWIVWSSTSLPGGCPFISAAIEYDDRPGPVRDHLVLLQKEMLSAFNRSATISIEEGQLASDIDLDHFSYELYSYMVGMHVFNRLLKASDGQENFVKSVTNLLARSSSEAARTANQKLIAEWVLKRLNRTPKTKAASTKSLNSKSQTTKKNKSSDPSDSGKV